MLTDTRSPRATTRAALSVSRRRLPLYILCKKRAVLWRGGLRGFCVLFTHVSALSISV
jgi:hypothetical protein